MLPFHVNLSRESVSFLLMTKDLILNPVKNTQIRPSKFQLNSLVLQHELHLTQVGVLVWIPVIELHGTYFAPFVSYLFPKNSCCPTSAGSMAAWKLFFLIPMNSLEEAKKSGNGKNKKQHSTQVANLVWRQSEYQ